MKEYLAKLWNDISPEDINKGFELTDKDGKRIMNEETGQSLTGNILCLPEDKNLLNIYKENEKNMDIKLDDLKKCSNMKIYEKR